MCLIEIVSFLFGGCLASFLISLYFYKKITPYLRNIINTDIACKIAIASAASVGANSQKVTGDAEKRKIQKDLLQDLFPSAVKYVKEYEDSEYATFLNEIRNLHGFTTFCQKDSDFGHNLTKEQNKLLKNARKEFLKNVAERVLKQN